MKKALFTIIILLATVLRFYNLGTVPPSPDWDEVAYGYNAYSILHTGRDEYGVKFPVVLRSYDDYKPALYSYLAIPSVSLFGLNPFAVRFPNAVFSVIGVIATYFLVKKLLNNEKVALFSSFLMAISPWQIQFTRFSHEATVGIALNILAVYFFLSSFKKPWKLIPSALLFGLTFYSYQSEKIFVPIIAVVLSVVYFKDWIKIPRKYIIGAGALFIIMLLPLASYLISDKNALSRAKGTSVFSHQTEILQQSANQLIKDKENHNIVGLIIHNRRIVYTQQMAINYLSHFNPDWLFIKGDLPRHHPPGMGVLYLWEAPFILLGVYFLIKNKFDKKNKLLIFLWFLAAPVPAMITYDVPHAGRTMNFLPMFQLLASLGFVSLFQFLSGKINKSLLKAIILIVAVGLLINFGYYLNQYFNNLNKEYSSEWQYGYKQAISFLNKQSGYKKIIVSNQVPLDQSYMFFLFYLKYSPQQYQRDGSNKGFDKYEFRNINWNKDSKIPDVLIVGSTRDIPTSANILKTVNYLNNKPAIIIAATKK